MITLNEILKMRTFPHSISRVNLAKVTIGLIPKPSLSFERGKDII